MHMRALSEVQVRFFIQIFNFLMQILKVGRDPNEVRNIVKWF